MTLFLVYWLVMTLIAPVAFFRFLGYCQHRHGFTRDVYIGKEEVTMLFITTITSCISLPFFAILCFIGWVNRYIINPYKNSSEPFFQRIHNVINGVE